MIDLHDTKTSSEFIIYRLCEGKYEKEILSIFLKFYIFHLLALSNGFDGGKLC